jgi:hypothetical protein
VSIIRHGRYAAPVLKEVLDEEVVVLDALLGRKASGRFDRWCEGFVLAIAAAIRSDDEHRPEGPSDLCFSQRPEQAMHLARLCGAPS